MRLFPKVFDWEGKVHPEERGQQLSSLGPRLTKNGSSSVGRGACHQI